MREFRSERRLKALLRSSTPRNNGENEEQSAYSRRIRLPFPKLDRARRTRTSHSPSRAPARRRTAPESPLRDAEDPDRRIDRAYAPTIERVNAIQRVVSVAPPTPPPIISPPSPPPPLAAPLRRTRFARRHRSALHASTTPAATPDRPPRYVRPMSPQLVAASCRYHSVNVPNVESRDSDAQPVLRSSLSAPSPVAAMMPRDRAPHDEEYWFAERRRLPRLFRAFSFRRPNRADPPLPPATTDTPWQTPGRMNVSASPSVASFATSDDASRSFLPFRGLHRRVHPAPTLASIASSNGAILRDDRPRRRFHFRRPPVQPVEQPLDTDNDPTSLQSTLAALINHPTEPCTPEALPEQLSASSVRFYSVHTNSEAPTLDEVSPQNHFSGTVLSFSHPPASSKHAEVPPAPLVYGPPAPTDTDWLAHALSSFSSPEGTLSAASASGGQIAPVVSDTAIAPLPNATSSESQTHAPPSPPPTPPPQEERCADRWSVDRANTIDDALSSDLSRTYSDNSFDEPPFPFVPDSSHVELSSVEISTDVLSLDSDERFVDAPSMLLDEMIASAASHRSSSSSSSTSYHRPHNDSMLALRGMEQEVKPCRAVRDVVEAEGFFETMRVIDQLDATARAAKLNNTPPTLPPPATTTTTQPVLHTKRPSLSTPAATLADGSVWQKIIALERRLANEQSCSSINNKVA